MLKRLVHEESENSGDRILDDCLLNSLAENDDQPNIAAQEQPESEDRSSPASTEIQQFSAIGARAPNGRFVLNRTQREKVKQRFPNCKFVFVAPHASSTKTNRKAVWDVTARVNSIAHVFTKEESDIFVPRSYRQAMQSNDRLLWQAEMDEEHNRFQVNKVYRLVRRPEGKRVLPGMWLFKVSWTNTVVF